MVQNGEPRRTKNDIMGVQERLEIVRERSRLLRRVLLDANARGQALLDELAEKQTQLELQIYRQAIGG